MTPVAITIGCYRLVEFVRLNILRCRRLLPDVPILLSDDRSPESPQIEALAKELECDYVVGETRRSHFSGDWQCFANGIVFARELEADIAVKLSQRCVPVLPGFFAALERAFNDPECQVVMPGQLNANQISRPTARFYRKFGLLTDMVAMRATAIEPEEMLSAYRERATKPGRRPSDLFAETSWGWLLEHKFPGPKHKLLAEWTHHEQGRPKLYLRKSQSTASDYAQVAKFEGIDNFTAELREWVQVEGKQNYKPCADVL